MNSNNFLILEFLPLYPTIQLCYPAMLCSSRNESPCPYKQPAQLLFHLPALYWPRGHFQQKVIHHENNLPHWSVIYSELFNFFNKSYPVCSNKCMDVFLWFLRVHFTIQVQNLLLINQILCEWNSNPQLPIGLAVKLNYWIWGMNNWIKRKPGLSL